MLLEQSIPYYSMPQNRYSGTKKKTNNSLPDLLGNLERSLVHKDVSHFPDMSTDEQHLQGKTADNQTSFGRALATQPEPSLKFYTL